jgi:hypothetical protein
MNLWYTNLPISDHIELWSPVWGHGYMYFIFAMFVLATLKYINVLYGCGIWFLMLREEHKTEGV